MDDELKPTSPPGRADPPDRGGSRVVERVITPQAVMEGAGVRLMRSIATPTLDYVDPFLLFDHFGSDEPTDYLAGFPWHPHRGIETITYVLAGEVEHGDSMGNSGVISSGDVQWMTAGGGIIHQEMPKGDAQGVLRGFQLWANLPAANKMMAPRYRGIEQAQIPQVNLPGGATARIICGEAAGTKGPVGDVVIEPLYMDITVPAGGELHFPVPKGHTVMTYVIDGKGQFAPESDPFAFDVEGRNYFDLERECQIGTRNLVVFGEGDELAIAGGDAGVRFLLIAGKPIGEPVAWHGPIVMNTQAELRQAISDLQNGTFIR